LAASPATGISRDSRHKRRATGGKKPQTIKKRKYELGRQAAMTKLGAKRIHTVRVRGGHLKYRALRLDAGNFAWGSESVTRKTRVIDVVYNASNNELVRTKTIVKGCVVQIDATPFRQWFEAHYGVPLGRKKAGGSGKKEVRRGPLRFPFRLVLWLRLLILTLTLRVCMCRRVRRRRPTRKSRTTCSASSRRARTMPRWTRS
jgi:ribosomal protein eS8